MTIRRSSYLAFASRYASIFINFTATVIIARLLTPGEIGVFTVSAAFVTLSQILRDFGIANYLVQERDLDRKRTEAAMGVGLGVAVVLAAVIVAAARPISWFYDNAGMTEVLYILSFTFLLNVPSSIGLALLRRNFEFRTSFWFETGTNLSWAVTAVVLAYFGYSFLSLAWASLTSCFVLLFLFLALRPGLVLYRPSFSEWRRVVRYGSFDTAANIVAQIGVLSPAIILGRVLGFGDVAFYNRGNSLTKMFRDTIESGTRMVALPAFSAQMRQGGFERQKYLYATSLLTGLSWPFFSLLCVLAYPVVRILFGDQWDASVPVVQCLALGNMVNALSILAPFAVIALGGVHLTFYRALAVQGLRLAFVFGFSFYGIEAVAVSQIAVYAFAFFVNQSVLNRITGLKMSEIAKSQIPSLAVTAASMIGPIFAVLLYPPGPGRVWLPFAAGSATAAAGWLIAVFALDHPARREITILVRKMRSLAPLPYRA